MSKEGEIGDGQRRRSTRISELQAKATTKSKCLKDSSQRNKKVEAAKKCTTTIDASGSPSVPKHSKRRGRKRKRLQDVSLQQDGKHRKDEHTSFKLDQRANLSSLQQIPGKQTLEFVLDILQRRDKNHIFAQPVDPKEVEGYYSIIKEPMDFGTMRAKLQEGLYTSLEQFQRDVFLISSNAMHFNSSTTVYHREARAIHEQAQQVFHVLKIDPENFELEFSSTRRHPSWKPQSDVGGSYAKLARPGGVKIGISPNGLPLKRSNEANITSSCLKSHVNHTDYGIPSGSRDCKNFELFESERRQTYRPWTSFSSGKGPVVSAVYNSPQILKLNDRAGIGYMESLRRFVKDLGPTAQRVASRKCLLLASLYQSHILPFSSKTPACLLPVPSAAQRLSHLDGYSNVQTLLGSLHDIPVEESNVRKYANNQLDIYGNAFKQDIHDKNNSSAYRGKQASAIRRKETHSVPNYDFAGTRNDLVNQEKLLDWNVGLANGNFRMSTDLQDTSGKIYTCDPSKGKMICTSENTNLLYQIARGDITYQYQNSQIQSGLHFSVTGIQHGSSSGFQNTGSKYTASDVMTQSSQMPAQVLANESQSSLLELSSNCSEPSFLPPQTTKRSNLSQATTSCNAIGSQYLGGRWNTSLPELNANYAADSTLSSQHVEWNLPPIQWFPNSEMQLHEENPMGQQDTFLQQETQNPYVNAYVQEEMPLFHTLNFYERGSSHSQHAEANAAQCFWDVKRQSLMGNQQPDLALQL